MNVLFGMAFAEVMNVLFGMAFVLGRGGAVKRTEWCLSFSVLQLESDQMHLIQLTPLLSGARAAVGYLWMTHLAGLKTVFFFDEVCLPLPDSRSAALT